MEKLQIYDSSLLIGQSYFFNDGAQLYLIFQMLYYILKRVVDSEKILPAEKITTPTTTDTSLSPSIKWHENSNYFFGI